MKNTITLLSLLTLLSANVSANESLIKETLKNDTSSAITKAIDSFTIYRNLPTSDTSYKRMCKDFLKAIILMEQNRRLRLDIYDSVLDLAVSRLGLLDLRKEYDGRTRTINLLEGELAILHSHKCD